MITTQNILFHELIGLNVSVVDASNQYLIGINGKIIYETKNTVVINTPEGLKTVAKKYSTFRLTFPSGKVASIDGSAIVMAPEKRINMRVRTKEVHNGKRYRNERPHS